MSNPIITVPTWTPGPLDATSGNMQKLSDGITQLQGGTPATGGPLDFTVLVQATAQTGLTLGWNAATFDTTSEAVDRSGNHSVSVQNSRIVPKTPGWVEVGGVGSFAAGSGSRRNVAVRLNGNEVIGSQANGGPIASGATCIALPPGIWVPVNGTTDYLELFLYADYASWATAISGSAVTRFTVRTISS